MDLRLICGRCKGERSFEKLKRDVLSKIYHWATLVSCLSCNFKYYYCLSCDKNKSRQKSNKHLVLKSRMCRHDRTYHNNDKEFIFESDSDEVSETY